MADTNGGSIIWDLDVNDKEFKSKMSGISNEAKKTADSVDKNFSNASSGIAKSFDKATKASQIFAGGLLALGSGAIAMGGLGLKTADEFETLTTALETVTGSSDQAIKAMETIKRVAKESPFFETRTLAEFAQKMTAAGQSIDQAVASGIRFGDVAAAFSKGNLEVERMGNTLTQVIGKGKADTVDFKELVNSGWVSVRKDVAATMKVSMAQFEDLLSSGKITYAELEKAAGKYAGSAEKQSSRLTSTWGRLKETISTTFSDIVIETGVFDKTKEAIQGLITVIESIDVKKTVDFLRELTVYIPIITGAIIGGLVPSLKLLIPWILGVGASFLSWIPFVLIGAAIGAIITGIILIYQNWGAITDWLNDKFGVFMGIINDLRKTFEDNFTKVKDKFTDVTDYLGGKIDYIIDKFNTFKDAVNSIIDKVESRFNEFKEDPLAAWDRLLTNLETLVYSQFDKIGVRIKQKTEEWFNDMSKPFKPEFWDAQAETFRNWFWGKLDSIMVDVGVWVTKLENKFTEFWDGLPTKSETGWNDFKSWLVTKFDENMVDVGVWVTKISDKLYDFWLNLGTKTQPATDQAMQDTSKNITDAFEKQRPQILALMARTMFLAIIAIPALIIAGAFLCIWDLYQAYDKAVKENTKKLQDWFVASFSKAIKAVGDWVWEKLGEFKGWGESMGKAMVDGFWSALQSLKQKAIDAINSAKSVLQGHSPPKEGPFKDIDKWGANVGQAWIDGLSNAISSFDLSAFDLGQTQFQPAYINGLQYQNTGNAGGGVKQEISINIGQVSSQEDIDSLTRELGFRASISPDLAL